MKKELKICANCSKESILYLKQCCSSCYYKIRHKKDPNKIRLKNRKAYYKRRGFNVENMTSDQFEKQNLPKSRKERNFNRFYRLILATPKWLSKEDTFKLFAERVPLGLSKDHIIPLYHTEVSGLNVPWNIQYLSIQDNNIKKNKFDGTYENESWKKEIS